MSPPNDAGVEPRDVTVLIRGVGDIGSAVAHLLFSNGYSVIVHEEPQPTTTRRGMAFAGAVFEGHAVLDGVRAIRADSLERVKQALAQRDVIPVLCRAVGTAACDAPAPRPRRRSDAKALRTGGPAGLRRLYDWSGP